MKDDQKIKDLLNIVKSSIEAHVKFKKEYERQLAFDFSLFHFFSVGENKISQIFAYFLDEKQNHGQGNRFLNEFVETFYEKINISDSEIFCEKPISEKRRIDIYIKFKDFTIAIENKIWADDQTNQLKDYASFLEEKTKGKYLLLYLNPYGLEPTSLSIDEKTKKVLIDQKKIKIVSYKYDIINLINKWLTICEAENVSHFLKEFKKFLEIKFLGKNTLNMSKELRDIINNNEPEVQQLVNEYIQIENEILSKLNSVGKELDKISYFDESDIEINKVSLFNYENQRIYKVSLKKNRNIIFIQFVKKGIHLYSHYYLKEGTDTIFNEILAELKINNNIKINYNQNSSELIKIFQSQINIVNEGLRIYDERFGAEK